MRDVSKRAFTAVLDAATNVGLEAATLQRLQEPVSKLGNWAGWDRWVDFLDRVEAETRIRGLGGLKCLGKRFPDVNSLAFLRRIFPLVASPGLLYLRAGKWVGQSLFPEVECDTSELGDGRLSQTLTVPGHWQDSTAFFDLMWGALITAPRLISLSDSHVEMERSDHRATYTIVPPPSMSLGARWARAFRTVRSGADHDVIELFSHMVERLQQGNRDVQALWERAESRNDDLRAALEENQRVTAALAKAREELEYRVQAEESDALLNRLRSLSRQERHRGLLARVADFVEAIDAGP